MKLSDTKMTSQQKIGYILNDEEVQELENQVNGNWPITNIVDYGKFKVMRHNMYGETNYEIVMDTETGEYIKPGCTRKIGTILKTDLGFIESAVCSRPDLNTSTTPFTSFTKGGIVAPTRVITKITAV